MRKIHTILEERRLQTCLLSFTFILSSSFVHIIFYKILPLHFLFTRYYLHIFYEKELDYAYYLINLSYSYKVK